jgi:hypothetical protein
VALNIDIKQLLVFDSTVNKLAKQYSLPPYVAASRLFNEIKDYNKIGGLKKELSGYTCNDMHLFKLAHVKIKHL